MRTLPLGCASETGSDTVACKPQGMETHPEGGTVIPWPGPTREQETDQAPEPECELVPAAELVAAFTVALREEIERQQRRRAAGVKALLLACLAGLLGGTSGYLAPSSPRA